MAGNADNIIVGAATISFDAADVGFTQGGATIRYEPEWVEVFADQAVGVVARRRSSERMFVTMGLLEASLTRIMQAFNQPSGQLVGSTLTLGYNNSCSFNTHAIVLVGVGPSCGTRTFTFPTCIAVSNTDYVMQRDEAVVFEIEFEVLKDASGNFGTVVDS